MKIKSKLLILFLSMAIVGISFIGMIVFQNAEEELKSLITKQQSLLIDQEAERINAFVKRLNAVIGALSLTPPVSGFIRAEKTGYDDIDQSTYKQWKQRLERIFTAFLMSNPPILKVRFIDENGNEKIRLDKKDNQIEVVADQDLQNKADRPYFQETKKLKEGEIYISPIDLNQEYGKYSRPYQMAVRFATPVFDERDGTFQGIVIITAAPDEIFPTPQYIQHGKMMILDDAGRYIYDSGIELEKRGETFLQKTYFSERPELKSNLEKMETNFLYDSRVREFRQWKKVRYDPFKEDKYIVLVMTVGLDEILTPIHKVRTSSQIIVFIFIVLIGFLIYMVSHVLTEPITRLKKVTDKIAEGNLDVVIDADIKKLKDEIGSFAQSFQRMTDSLKEAKKKVAEHTEALELKAEELARSNKDLEQFAYVASHDLQEPVRKIVSFSQLFAKKYQSAVDDQGRQYLDYITGGAKRMQTLISDLLRYSRLKRDWDVVDVPLEDVFKEIQGNLEQVIADSKAVIHHDPLPTVRASRTYMVQLFQNLVGNALKYRGQETPVIHIRAEKDHSFWLFSVQDNGIGIDAEHLDRIFIIFERLHGNNEYEGTGIGLAICKRIVELHGGRIWAESNGKGTTFKFTLKRL